MTDELFSKLWHDALEQSDKDLYISEYGYPDWFDDISTDGNELIRILENIHLAAHMSVKDIIASAGLTQNAFAVKFCIPLRTVENWAAQERKCADYLRLSFCRQLGIIKN